MLRKIIFTILLINSQFLAAESYWQNLVNYWFLSKPDFKTTALNPDDLQSSDKQKYWIATEPIEVENIDAKFGFHIPKGTVFPDMGENYSKKLIWDSTRIFESGKSDLQKQISKYPFFADHKGKIESIDLKNKPLKMYLDAPKGQIFTITRRPGMGHQSCLEDQQKIQCVSRNENTGTTDPYCNCRAWPEAGEQFPLSVLDSKVHFYQEPHREPELFYKVNVQYLRNGVYVNETGWISADRLTHKPKGKSNLSISEIGLKTQIKKQEKDCPESQPDPVYEGADALSEMVNNLLDDDTESFLPHVGSCKKSFSKKWLTSSNNQREREYPSFKSKKVTRDQMFAIDAMARTLFGEMRGCFKNGVRYPTAIAKVILNRAYLVSKKGRKSPFYDKKTKLDPKGKSHTVLIPHIVSAPSQFSTWNHDDPNSKKIKNICSKDLNDEQAEIWKKSVEIAKRAVLDVDNFMNETKEVRQINYSSRIQPWWVKKGGMSEAKVSVGGLPIDSQSCLRLWDDNILKDDWIKQKDGKFFNTFLIDLKFFAFAPFRGLGIYEFSE